MAEPGKHRGGGVSPPPRPTSTAAAPAGRRRAPAGHRRRRRAFPAAPVAAGFFTIVAATTGVITLETASGDTTLASDGKTPQMPAGIALSVSQLRETRDDTTDRSGRDAAAAAVEQAAAEHARKSEEASERAEWEAERAKELAALEADDADTNRVIERVIRWVAPVTSYRLSAGFGDSGSLWSADHTGQDFSAPMGTPVRAVGAGEVIEQTYDPASYGNMVVVRHEDGTETWYCHLSSFGESGTVSAGEVIGYVGSTGNSTGPHLHLEVRPYGGDPIDPLVWLRGLGLDL